MSIIVQKFGGTSIANLDRITRVAKLIASEVEKGNQVAVVVSAMSGVTNQLVEWANQSSKNNVDSAEYDVVVSTGEQVSCGLLAMTLQSLGIKSRSWLAWQLGIKTDEKHQNAQIYSIDTKEIIESMKNGSVAVIAGFQGINSSDRVTTLGRGGSDTTAVALSYVLQAERCDIYTDVDGVFTADPQVVPNARKLDSISYKSMLAMSYHGAKVLQPQSVELAMNCRIPVEIKSSFSLHSGTKLMENVPSEESLVGISCDEDVSLFVLRNLKDANNVFPGIVKQYNSEKIGMTLSVIKKAEHGEGSDFVFTVQRRQMERSKLILHELSDSYNCEKIEDVSEVANLAIVGNNIEENKKEIISLILFTLEKNQIKSYGIVRYPNKIVIIVEGKSAQEGVRFLHNAFKLEDKKQPIEQKEPALEKTTNIN